MTLSRLTALALLLPAQLVRAEEALTAEQATENYRRLFPTLDALDCPPPQGDEVVVCGRRDRTMHYRLPLPVEAEPGGRVAGEPPAASVASRERCSTVGPNQNCGGALPVAPAIGLILRVVEKVVEGDD